MQLPLDGLVHIAVQNVNSSNLLIDREWISYSFPMKGYCFRNIGLMNSHCFIL